jgi:hypothetical protein
MKTITILIVCLLSSAAYSQDVSSGAGQPRTINTSDPMVRDGYNTNRRLNPGLPISQNDYLNRLNSFIPDEHKYDTDTFTDGYLVFASGKKSGVYKVKYNHFLRIMLFIDRKGDTLMFEESPMMKYVVTEKKVFFHHISNGFYEVLAGQNSPVVLGSQCNYVVSQREAVTSSAHRDLVSTPEHFSILYVSHDPSMPKEEILFTKKKELALIDQQDRIYKPNKIGFIKAFPRKEDEIKKFIRTESVKFNREDDLKKLLNYCISRDDKQL